MARPAQWQVYLFGTITVLVLSGIAFIGAFTIPFMPKRGFQNAMLFFMALAVGTMTADAFLHLLPQVLGLHTHRSEEDKNNTNASLDGHAHGKFDQETAAQAQAKHYDTLFKLLVGCLTIYVLYLFEALARLYTLRIKHGFQKDTVLPAQTRKESNYGGPKILNLAKTGQKTPTGTAIASKQSSITGLHNDTVLPAQTMKQSHFIGSPKKLTFTNNVEQGHYTMTDSADSNSKITTISEVTSQKAPNSNVTKTAAASQDVSNSIINPSTSANSDDLGKYASKILSEQQFGGPTDKRPQVHGAVDWGLGMADVEAGKMSADVSSNNSLRIDDDLDSDSEDSGGHTGPYQHRRISTTAKLPSGKKIQIFEGGHGHSHHGGISEALGDKLICGMKPVVFMIIFGGGLHNFADGLALGASFSVSLTLGLSTAIALLCHEVPHELGDFAVLLNTGLSVKMALFLNGVSAIPAIVGLYIAIALSAVSETVLPWVFAVVLGTFVYIALVAMLNELREVKPERMYAGFFLSNAGIIVGGGLLTLLAFYEDKIHF